MKKKIRHIPLLTLLLVISLKGMAQMTDTAKIKSNLRIKTIPVVDTLILDKLSIAPKSFKIIGVPKKKYQFFPAKAQLIWTSLPQKDSVTIVYRTFPLALSKKHQHHSKQLIDSNIAFPFHRTGYNSKTASGNDFVNFKGLEYNGTYGRSLTIGNQQDVTLNSNFAMQLNGYIMDSIRIEAALSDNNVPFQPEGNTQRVQEFDKLYITFEKGPHKLTAGDYQITRPKSHFMNFNKRVQGLYYQGAALNNKNIKNRVGVSASIAKGQFARNIFKGEEANQGPYKLKGNNGEQFFIVLAGSEKVYVDGLLMTRGENKDYVIDYNKAEITFMPGCMITKDSRIQVEFEYQDRNYLNTLLYGYDDITIHKKWHFRFNAYSNQDSKNQSFQQDLSGAQKQFLRSIGDHINQAYYPSINRDTLSPNKILYRMTDTAVNGFLYDSVFVYSTNQDSALYSLGFSYVGEHKGNYKIGMVNTNGRTYQWVAPIDGIPQGNYAPYRLLVTPKKQQMFTLAGDYQIDSSKKVGIEVASSNYAPNLFSQKDNTDHWGFAGKAFYEGKQFFGHRDSVGHQKWQWQNKVGYEWTQSTFKPIAPFRNVEFKRDWNIKAYDSVKGNTPAPSENDEHLINFQTGVRQLNWGSLSYHLSYYQKGQEIKANRHIATLNLHHGLFKGGLIYNLLFNHNPLQKSRYLRPSAFLERAFPKVGDITLGVKWEEEHNHIRQLSNDHLSKAAFDYDIYSLYLKNSPDKKAHYSLSYKYRTDKTPGIRKFLPESKSQTIKADLSFNQWKGQQIKLTGAYRLLKTKDSTLANSPSGGQNILARLQYNGNILKGFLMPASLYELGSGQQQKQEYIYVKVPTGQGVYMWVDYNNDSIQQANEFERAIYPDQKQYIRILSPTNNFVPVNYTIFTQALSVNPENLWIGQEKKGWQKFISRFSDRLSVQINNRSLAKAGLKGFNPFTSGIENENIISNQTSLNNTFYFNQMSSVWGVNYNYSLQSGKSLLTYGLEGQQQKRHTLATRLVFLKSFTANFILQQGRRKRTSAVPNDGRAYDISGKIIHPQLTWLMGTRLRIKAGYKWNQRQNSETLGGQTAKIQSFQLDTRLSFRKTGIINISGTYAAIKYDGQENTPISFSMLDALKKGNNWLWHINWTRNIGKGLQISLEYNGRKSEGKPVIHSGTMSISALL